MNGIRPAALSALVLSLAACVHAPPKTAARAPASGEYEEGGFLVDEKRDAMYISATTVIVADAAKREEYESLLAASRGGGGGPLGRALVSMDAPRVQTVDEYVAGLKEGGRLNREAWQKSHPNEPYVEYYKPDYEAMRAELAGKIAGRRGLVLRYVQTKEKRAELARALPALPRAERAAPETPPSAVDLDRESQQLYLEGIIYYQKGDYEKARAQWKKAVELDPHNSDAKAGLEKINKLYGSGQ